MASSLKRLAPLALMAALAACAAPVAPGSTSVVTEQGFKDEVLGANITGYTVAKQVSRAPGGGEDGTGEAKVALAGQGEHEVSFSDHDAPMMSDAQDKVTITDETTNSATTFAADQDFTHFEVIDGGNTLTIDVNPDRTYLIDGEAAATPEAAAELAVKSPLLADASAHGLALLYAALSVREPEPSRFPPRPPIKEIVKGSGFGRYQLAQAQDEPVALLVRAILIVKAR